MSNHKKIYNHFKTSPGKPEFGYQQVYAVANTVVEATSAGKDYAVLRFLQEYCTPVDKVNSVISAFRGGDPRRYRDVKSVRSKWKFRFAKAKNAKKAKVKSVRKIDTVNLTMAKSGSNEENYSDFVAFIANELSAFNEDSYKWEYSIKDRVDWLNDDLRKGETLPQAHKALTSAGAILKYSLDNNNQQLCFESVRSIMDWGGVYYPQGPRSGNQKRVEALHKENALLENVLCDYQRFRIEKVDNITLMNAGWTKVWSVLFPNQFVMFDSRVSFAFTKLLAAYCNNKEEENGYFSFPSEHGYRQIKQGNRDVEGFRPIGNNPVYWSKSMLITSHILKSCLSYAEVKGIDICRYDPNLLRSVEARLFMMGA